MAGECMWKWEASSCRKSQRHNKPNVHESSAFPPAWGVSCRFPSNLTYHEHQRIGRNVTFWLV